MGDDKSTEKVARLESTVDYMKGVVERLESKLESKFDQLIESLDKRFMTRNEHGETTRRLESELRETKAELKETKHEIRELSSKVGKMPPWAAALMSFVSTLLIALVIYYLTHNSSGL